MTVAFPGGNVFLLACRRCCNVLFSELKSQSTFKTSAKIGIDIYTLLHIK